MNVGRIRRRNYVIFLFIQITISFCIYINPTFDTDSISLSNLIILICIASVCASLYFIAGRLNDINKSGWYSLLAFVPIINLLGFVLIFIDGTQGPNKYGADPKGRVNEKKYTSNKITNHADNAVESNLTGLQQKMQLLEDSKNDGLLTDLEFQSKRDDLNSRIRQSEERNARIEKDFQTQKKLKKLLNNGLISQQEYDSKISDYTTPEDYDVLDISFDTMFFYVSKGVQYRTSSSKKNH